MSENLPEVRPNTTALPDVVNPATGEIVTRDPYEGIGGLLLTHDEASTLTAPIPAEDLDILPTGEVYASQVRYRRILNQVFGPGGWGLRPMSEPKVQGLTIMRLYALYCRGKFVAEAPGEADYQPGNSRMSYATALEAAKSNALTRCCKDLGIASECWDKHFCEQFKRHYCESYQDRGQRRWRRKGESAPVDIERRSTEPALPVTITDPQRRRLFAICKNSQHSAAEVRAWLAEVYRYKSTNDITAADYEAICTRLQDPTPLNEPEPPPEMEAGEAG